MHRVWRPTLSAVLFALPLFLPACGKEPPRQKVLEEIERAVLGERPDIYDAGTRSAEVTDIKVAGWQHETTSVGTGRFDRYSSDWNANLRFKEPLGFILSQVDGSYVVQIVARQGEAIPFTGTVGSMDFDGQWETNAFVSEEPWQVLWDRAGQVTMGYSVIGGPVASQMRRTTFDPVSRLTPWVEEGSPEANALFAKVQERMAREQEAALARQAAARAAAEERQRQATAEAEERQRQQAAAAAEQRRLAEEAAAERRRQAEEAAAERQRQAEEARHARLLPLIQPFASAHGTVLATDAGPLMGSVLLETEVDEAQLTAVGRGVDLRAMPFADFSFEASVNQRGALSYRSSVAEAPLPLALGRDGILSGGGLRLATLSEEERRSIDSLLELGRKVQGAEPLDLEVEILDAAASKERETALQLAPLEGTVIFRNRNSPNLLPMFAGDLAANRSNYRWIREPLSLRLREPVKGTALYFRSSGATDNLVVVVNGIHRATIPAVERLGAALILLPGNLQVLDLRFEAGGSAQARGVGLVR